MGLFKPTGLANQPREVFNLQLFWSVGVFGKFRAEFFKKQRRRY